MWRYPSGATLSRLSAPAGCPACSNGRGLVPLVVYFEGDFECAEALLVESVARYRDLGDETGLVFPLRFLGQVLTELGRFPARRAGRRGEPRS